MTPSDLPAVVDLLEALPGLPDHDRYALAPVPDSPGLFTFRAEAAPDDVGPRLFLVDPRAFVPGYEPTLAPEVQDRIATTDPLVLAVLHPGSDGEPPTVNLLAPVLVNLAGGIAVQHVLEGTTWPLREPLVPA